MTRYAIDAATLLELATAGRAVHPAHQLVAPAGIRSHALDLLLAQVAAGELDERTALVRHDRITETRVRLLNDRVSRRVAWEIARQLGFASVRDAEYLAIAKLQADALVTADPALSAAAAGLVPVAQPEALFRA